MKKINWIKVKNAKFYPEFDTTNNKQITFEPYIPQSLKNIFKYEINENDNTTQLFINEEYKKKSK